MRIPTFLALFAIQLLAPTHALAQAPAKRPPNVIVILTDDQGWGDLSLHGNKNFQTPHIDSIGRGGAVCEYFYACPVCSPTRAEFLTGRYYPRTGVRSVTSGLERINLGERTIAQLFRAAGYRTGIFGKWHNGSQWPYHPCARGFEEFYGFTSGHWGEYFDAPLEHNGNPVHGKGYIADDLTDKALTFIEKNRNEPFFCYVPYNTPHSPYCVPDDEWNRFKDLPILQRGVKNENLAVTRCALAMVANIDGNVGKILAKLEALKLTENTIVVFITDNGPNSTRWCGGMRGRKASVDEGGVRVPCLLRWPSRIAAGTRVPQIAGCIDLLPTLARLAEVPLDPKVQLDGRDLSPLLLGQRVDWPEREIYSTFAGKVSVRTQNFRLDADGRLYDMVQDLGQTTDVSARHPELAQDLTAKAKQWRQEIQSEAQDQRPFTVGYAEFPRTPLPARDGVPQGKIARSAGAPNCSYFTNWTSTEDAIKWHIEVHTAGTYQVRLHYTCPAADLGSTVELSFQNARTSGKVEKAWDPPLNKQDDRVPRSSESYMKDFRELALPDVALPQGRGSLTLRATDIPGRWVMDLRGISLILQ